MINLKSIALLAYAKVNLSLDICGKRDDGYHNLVSIMQTVSLADHIEIKLSSVLTVSTNIKSLDGASNLTFSACRLFGVNANIRIKKNIPQGAGLGGGSSDAAAVLYGLNRLTLKYSDEELIEMGAALGSDVPFFFRGGTQMIAGRGEILTPLDDFAGCYILLVKPDFSISTKNVYKQFDTSKLYPRPDTGMLLKNLQNLSVFSSYTENSLETAAMDIHPVIGQLKGMMRDTGAKYSLMSGSGSVVFGVFDDFDTAKNAETYFKKMYREVYLTIPVQKGHSIKNHGKGNNLTII